MIFVRQPSKSGWAMHFLSLFCACIFVLSIVPLGRASVHESRQPRRQWAVQLQDPDTHKPWTESEAEAYALENDFTFLGQVGALEGYFLFETDICFDESTCAAQPGQLQRRSQDEIHKLLLDSQNVKWFEKQVPKKRHKRELDIKTFPDPLLPQQWHLYNDGVNGIYQGHDINVLPVWSRGINGSGVTVSVIDDGVQYTHPDLSANWYEEGSYDFNERTKSPLPQSRADTHGTRCAGEIAAAVNNVCGVGVAFGVRLAAQRLIANSTVDAIEAQALNYHNQDIDIYSSSWGPDDDGASLDGPGYLAQKALEKGVQEGRKGLGNIFVFASGNGGEEGDNCNFDGFANAVQTVAIGAVTNEGMRPYYGEVCSAHLAVAYSGGNGLNIVTTDIGGPHSCTTTHSGTSAAAPLASGMIALMLSVRPDLGWRDVQHLIVITAKQTDPADPDWATNGAGFHINHKYGFGLMDAAQLVEAAEKHTLLPFPAMKLTKELYNNIQVQPAKQFGDAASVTVEVKEQDAEGLTSIEHIQVTVRLRHPDRKFLTIKLVSPQGTESILAAPRFKDDSDEGFDPWTFMTVRSWGEKPIGIWTLTIEDVRIGTLDPFTGEPLSIGELLGWSLIVHGTCGEEDVVFEPGQLQANGRTCSQTLAAARRQKRRATIAAILFVTAIGLMVAGYFVYKRLHTNRDGDILGSVRARLNISRSYGEGRGDIESPTYENIPAYPKSPVDIESPLPDDHKGKLPAPGVSRSTSIEMFALRTVRIAEGETSAQTAADRENSDESSSDEDDSETSHLTGTDKNTKRDKRIAAIREDYLKRSMASGSLSKASSMRDLASVDLPIQSSRRGSKTPPPNLSASSPKLLSRSSSGTNLLRRSASTEILLNRFAD